MLPMDTLGSSNCAGYATTFQEEQGNLEIQSTLVQAGSHTKRTEEVFTSDITFDSFVSGILHSFACGDRRTRR